MTIYTQLEAQTEKVKLSQLTNNIAGNTYINGVGLIRAIEPIGIVIVVHSAFTAIADICRYNPVKLTKLRKTPLNNRQALGRQRMETIN